MTREEARAHAERIYEEFFGGYIIVPNDPQHQHEAELSTKLLRANLIQHLTNMLSEVKP